MIDVGGEGGARARKTEMQREKDGVRERPRARDRERERRRPGGFGRTRITERGWGAGGGAQGGDVTNGLTAKK